MDGTIDPCFTIVMMNCLMLHNAYDPDILI